MSDSDEASREKILNGFLENTYIAHQVLFAGKRHADPTPAFHQQIIREWHDDCPQRIFMVFRGGGKSTISEEAFIIKAVFGLFRFGFIVSDTESRAIERLQAIAHELDSNLAIEGLLGPQRGNVWQATKIVLKNGTCIQAVGAGQSIRGIKHLESRPDCAIVDDVEGDQDAYTKEQRENKRRWFNSTFLPVLDPRATVRIVSTPLDVEALPLMLSRDPKWPMTVVPIESIDPDTGERVATWPHRYSLPWIDAKKSGYAKMGALSDYNREFMCEAVLETERVFKQEYFRSEIIQRHHQPVYVAYDPARTTNRATSDMTGKAVWSKIGDKLVVWNSSGNFWSPKELIDDIFLTARAFNPVWIGVEETGLNEFIMQPLRSRQLQEGVALPLKALKATTNKIDFITKALQPYFKAGEVVFVGDGHEILKEQLLNFPRGHDDAPNALAYHLKLSPGQAVYGEFGEQHQVPHLKVKGGETIYVVVNADQHLCSIQAFQFVRGKVLLFFDAVQSGPRGEAIPDLFKKIALEFGRAIKVYAPAEHFKLHDTLGLRAAARAAGLQVNLGGDLIKGGEELRRLLRTEGELQVGYRASGTIKALLGGYNTEPSRDSADSIYSLLAHGLECFVGRLSSVREAGDNVAVRMETSKDGRQYMSSRA